ISAGLGYTAPAVVGALLAAGALALAVLAAALERRSPAHLGEASQTGPRPAEPVRR
ncbi:MFS transporter, partial [Streptomyces hyaluromycini]